ncbi:M56 family metallopeptidase [Mangrovivirga sp. M17]|uniref:M56 family metallopeptidase n=1 Tax=Mangrovivirga halotolerans TaxID=2993936 RepID=A0ABT3RUZ7_9BACT|nr:M56 family metallopeptidase [Mangrovivirga halotolerans]MCX2745486.1 M56 family metallopeptidase [Mangrovivirga halotolerans]
MSVFYYLFISTFSLGLFYGVYKLLLNNKASFKINRLYLITGLVFSVLIPFQPWTIGSNNFEPNLITDPALINTLIRSSEVGGSIDSNELSWINIAFWIYILIVAILLFRILLNIIRITLLLNNSEKKVKQEEYILVYNKNIKTAFSFLKWIFIPKDTLSEKEVEKIILHEKTHALRYHSIDLILCQLLAATQWFNPIIWFYKSELELIHEYEADYGVINTGINKLEYQALIINQISEENLINITSPFNQSLIKKRIIMMNKNVNFKNQSSLKALIIVPLIMLISTGVACTKENDPSQIADTKNPSLENADYYVDGEKVSSIDNLDKSEIKSIDIRKEENGEKSVSVTTKSSDEKPNLQNVLYIVDGKTKPDGYTPKDLNPDDIKSIKVIKDKATMKEYTDGEYDGIILIITK